MDNISLSHPARYNKNLLPVFERMIGNSRGFLYDPMAGTGERLLELQKKLPNVIFFGTEIEPEWARITPSIVLGIDAFLYLKHVSSNWFDIILTSPTYGNRMADHHEAKDASKRNTYTHRLGRQLHENNSGKMQWGADYRIFHRYLWLECYRVLKTKGKFILNIKDHVRDGVIQKVTDWHIETLVDLGLNLVEHVKVKTPSLRNGENYNLRVPYESVILFSKD